MAVIGDGAMSAGMAYEAMNNAGAMDSRLIVILNDNDMSIAPPVGAMSAYLARLLSGRTYLSLREIGKHLAKQAAEVHEEPGGAAPRNSRAASGPAARCSRNSASFTSARSTAITSTICCRCCAMSAMPRTARSSFMSSRRRARATRRRKTSADKYHGVVKFDVVDRHAGQGQGERPVLHQGVRRKPHEGSAQGRPHRRHHRGDAVRHRPRYLSRRMFPKRTFDVGIAEQHGVTFAAGLAAEGFKPFAAIYSTFLQRAYDQVVHDVAIQRLPVRFAHRSRRPCRRRWPDPCRLVRRRLSRLPAELRDDGAPPTKPSLLHMVATAVAIYDRPSAFRYPRGDGVGVDMPAVGMPLEIGKGRIVREGSKVALLSLRHPAGRMPEGRGGTWRPFGLSTTVADARFAKPLDVGSGAAAGAQSRGR